MDAGNGTNGERHRARGGCAAVRTLGLAAALAASASAGAVNLIFDASPAPINTAQVADTSFWVGVNLPSVIASIVAPGSVTVNAGGHSAALGVNAGSFGNEIGRASCRESV